MLDGATMSYNEQCSTLRVSLIFGRGKKLNLKSNVSFPFPFFELLFIL